MCLMLAAEQLTLPDAVASEVQRFVQGNLDWLTEAFAQTRARSEAAVEAVRLFAAIEGVMVIGRALDRADLFEVVVAPWDGNAA